MISPSSTPQRPTYAAICKRIKIADEEIPLAMKSLAILHRRKPSGSIPSSSVEAEHKVRRLYIGNLPHLRLSELKSHLFNLRIQLSKILNLAYVGKSIVEFLIMEDYEASFRARISLLSLNLIEKYDPSTARDPKATEEIRETVRQAFRLRLAHIADQSTREPVRAFFRAWLDSTDPSSLSSRISTEASSLPSRTSTNPFLSSPSPVMVVSSLALADDTPMPDALPSDGLPFLSDGQLISDTFDRNADPLQPSVSSSLLL
jgi:hypothetical protein